MNTFMSSIFVLVCTIVLLPGDILGATPVVHEISEHPYITVPENYSLHINLFSFRVTDDDQSDKLQVTAADSLTKQYVTIQPFSGNNNFNVSVSLQKCLDRETQSKMVFKFSVSDSTGNVMPFEKTVYVSDVNDNAPEFQNTPYTIEVPELPCNITVIYSEILATDPDLKENGSVMYSMQPKTQSKVWENRYMATFSIDNQTGVITQRQCVDYENNSYYQFTITAYDMGQPTQESSIPLIIRVLDVQDRPPFFTGVPYMASIEENVPKGTNLLAVNAMDGDTGVSHNVSYNISNSTCDGVFLMDPNKGNIKTASTVDRDNGVIKNVSGTCKLTVKAVEIDNNTTFNDANSTASTDVTIIITDLNDNKPVFSNKFYSAVVPENTANQLSVRVDPRINITDADQGDNALFSLTIKCADNTTCDAFEVSPAHVQGTDNILVLVKNSTILDFEERQQITFTIVASETKNASHFDETEVIVNITDTNDNNPKFNTNQSWSFTVSENSDSGTSVGQITATDKDTPEANGQITYSVLGGNGRFIVDNTTGIIYTNCSNCSQELDRERQGVYYVTYTAKDGAERSVTNPLVITLTDVNDNTPKFGRHIYQAFVIENDNISITLEATDADDVSTNNSKIKYNIMQTTEPGFFANLSMDANTGELSLKWPVDYEKLNNTAGEINITVQVADLGTPSKHSAAVVFLKVQDENDNKPVFNSSRYISNIPENATSTVGQYHHVASVFAHDDDVTDRNKALNFYITGGSHDQFTINSSSGMVSVQLNAKLDRERVPQYNLTIIAIDQGSPPLTGTTTMQIVVQDVNDENPQFDRDSFEVSVKEDSQDMVVIKHCSASDPDVNSALRYGIINVEAKDENGKFVNKTLVEDYFDVFPDNGSVYVKCCLDRETAATVILTLQVTDIEAYSPRPQKNYATLTVILLDVNDNHPKFDNNYSTSVIENARDGSIMTTVHAVDKDVNRTITYGIEYEGFASNSFSIDPKTGIFTKNGSLDREAYASINLTVTATDDGVPPLNSSTVVLVTILDSNDNTPVFDDFSRTVHVKENRNEAAVLNVTATDADDGPNKNITFFLEPPDTKFTINQTTGVICASLLDREVQSTYKFMVIAKDNPLDIKEQKSTETTIEVIVGDDNDNSPIFASVFTGMVVEDVPVGTDVVTIIATDKDEPNSANSKISYSIVKESSTTNLFEINSDTGSIKVNSSLVGRDGSYKVNVMACDNGTQRRCSWTTVNINVLDKNLHKPVIGNVPPMGIIKVYECAKPGFLVHEFNYSNAGHGVSARADFHIVSSGTSDNVTDVFRLTANGALEVAGKLDSDTRFLYVFAMYATDRGEPKLTSEPVPLTMIVIGINDQPPSFSSTTADWYIPENSTGHVEFVSARGMHLVRSYILLDSAWSKYFSINSLTGRIINTRRLDHEAADLFKLTIEVLSAFKHHNVTGCNATDDVRIAEANKDANMTLEVTVHVLDVDDNPPLFKSKDIATGLHSHVAIDTELELRLRNYFYVSDNDTAQNGIHSWTFSNYGNISASDSLKTVDTNSGETTCEDNSWHIFCVTSNGTIVNNKYFSEELSGYFILPVKVWDKGGADYANITIYLVSEWQILKMIIEDNRYATSARKNDILRSLSTLLVGYEAVFDSLQDHKDSSQIDSQRSDLLFFLVKTDTKAVLYGQDALRIMNEADKTQSMTQFMERYRITSIVQVLFGIQG